MADEIPEPNLAPPASNVVTQPTVSEAPPTPEEIAAYEAQVGPPPAPAFNPIKELSAEDLADLAVKDKTFDIASAFGASPDLHGDQATVQKTADALNLVKQRGFKLEDLPSLPEAGKAVIQTAKGFGKQLWNYANAAGNIVQSAVADAVGAPGISEASRVEANRRLSANVAGTEEAMTGLAQLGEKAVGKAGRALGATKSFAEKTPEEKVSDLWAEVGKGVTQQERLTGQGPFTRTVTAGESAKAGLNPEETATLAAGDPFSFYLFGAATKGIGAFVPKGVSAVASAGAQTATEAAGTAARLVTGKTIQAAGKVAGGAAKAVEVTAPVVSPIAGAVKGGAAFGPTGAIGGFVAGERAGKIIAGGARKVGAVADNLADLGSEVASSAPVKSAYAQAGRDFLQALPGAAFETAKGAGIDLGLAAATAETPSETQGAAAFGTVLGGLHGAAKLGGRVISGQLIAPREYGVSTPQPSSRAFPALDALHNEAFTKAEPGVKARLNAMRQFVSGVAPGADVFYSDNPAKLATALEGTGMSPEQAQTWSQQNGFFTAELPDATGKPRRVTVVTNPESAPHEAQHIIQDVIGEEGNQAIDKLVKQSYAGQWDRLGHDYAQRLGGDAGKTWQETILDATGKGMTEAKDKLYRDIYNQIEGQQGAAPSAELVTQLAKEAYGRIMDEAVAANPHLSPEEIAQHAWREVLSPEEAGQAADTYMAREIAADNFDAIFKHSGPNLGEPTALPAKLARIVGRVMTVFGGEPLAERTGGAGETPLSTPVIEAVRRQAAGLKPEIEVLPRGKTAPIGKAPAGTPAEQARIIADEASDVPTERGTASERERLGAVAEAIAAREGVKINYLSAPDEPAAATTSNRETRRKIIETFRDMPADARSLWEKTFFPEKVTKTKGGKYQIFGWAPEVFAANAHKMAGFLSGHTDLSPYAIDAATKSFTPAAWKELYSDVQTFVQNQKAGQTGAGEPLVVPKSVSERGYTAPPSRAGESVPLDQNKADFINMLFNAKLPETPRLQKGKLPLNLAGQEVSAATLPGRVEVPVRPRGEYTGAEAERQGIAGREIAEVNPLRNAIEAAALADRKPMPSLIEANQMLNLENIKELERAPEQPEFRANTLTLQAGFEAKGLEDLPEVPEGFVRMYHGEGGPQGGGTGGSFYTTTPEKAATFGSRVSYVDLPAEAAATAREAAKKVGQGGDTALLTKADIARSREIGADIPLVTYDLDASFEPKAAMEKLKSLSDEEWQAQIGNFKGKLGGGLTGWAYDIGSQAKTAEDLQAFRSTNALIGEATKAAMSAGQFDKAMNLAARGQAAAEAYEAATGTKLDGTIKDVAKFVREHYDPTFEYSMPAGDTKANEPKNDVHAIAETYAAEAGIDYKPKRDFAKAPEALLKRVSDFYEKAVHAPTDPAVEKSYRALAAETEAQYNAIVDAGYKLEPFSGEGEPYKTSADMVRDVRENKHLFYLETDKAYGAGSEVKNNILLKPSGATINGKIVPVNDLFRAVHDFFGHAKEGYQFGPRGEFNAWKSHSELFSPEAQGALAAETLAQNAFVNFGPHMRTPEGKIRQKGEPGYLGATERPFGEQKNVVVPPEFLREAGAVRFEPKFTPKESDKGKFAEDTGFGNFWMSPEGKFFSVGDHGRWAMERLTPTPGEKPITGRGAEDSLKNKGWIRISAERETNNPAVFLDGRVLNEKQKSALEVWSAGNPNVEVIDTRSLGFAKRRDYGDAQFEPKKKEDLKFKGGKTGFTKAWILPNGTPVQLGGTWHHQWLSENPDVAKKYNLDVPPFEGGDAEGVREEALKKGFVRVVLNQNTGGLVVEARAQDWRKVKNTVQDMVEKNLDNVDTMTVSLLNENAKKVVDSAKKNLFDLDTDAEKMAALPFISTGEIRGGQFEPKLTKQQKLDREDDRNIAEAGKYFSIGHENPGSVVWMFDSVNGRLNTEKEGGSHAMAFGSGVAEKSFKGWYDPEANVVSINFPEQELRKIDKTYPDVDDIPTNVYDKLVRQFGRGLLWEVFPKSPKEKESLIGYFEPKGFEDESFPAELKKIRSGQQAGQTFNTDGTVWNRGEAIVDLVPLASVNVPQGKLTPDAFKEALAPYADLLDEPTIKAGVFSFSQDGKPIVSIDINAVVPQAFRKNSVEFAKANDQVAMWDAVKNENVETGGKGNTRLTKPNEIIDALDALTTGEPVDINEIKRQYAETAGRAEEQGALFAGGKEYVGNRAVADMTKAQLADAFPEVVIPRRRTDSIPSEIVDSPLYKQAGSEDKAVDAFARRLVEFSNEYKNDPSFKAGAEWYSNFVPKLKKEFGADAQVMAELLAATSPQTAVGVNFAYAFDALQSLKSGRFDKTIVKFKQGLDMMDNGKWLAWYNKENAAGNIPKPPAQPTLPAFLEAWINKYDLKPRQSNGALYGTHSIPVLQVFARKWLTESRGPKTLNFVKNLVGEGHEATIDLWADRTMRRVGYSGFKDRWRILPGNVQGVSAPDFAFAQKAFRKAAEELNMEPDALQGALWFAEKKLYHDKGWGRLDLGDFQAEMAKVPMMKAGFKQRVAAGKQRAKEKPVETPDLFTVEPRYPK